MTLHIKEHFVFYYPYILFTLVFFESLNILTNNTDIQKQIHTNF